MNELAQKSKQYALIAKAIEYIDKEYVEQPNLDEIAAHLGLSKAYFARLFKEYVGITPMQFLQATTLHHAQALLEVSRSNLDVSQEVGLSSSSRLHELFVNFTGLTPTQYKQQAKEIEIVYGIGFTLYGKAMIAHTSKGICALEFYEEDEEDVVERLHHTWQASKLILDNQKAQRLLNEIFIEHKQFPLIVKGTNFQINVWKALMDIGLGEVQTYSDIAHAIGKPKSVRAVATAIGSNHIALLIPCHRVLAKTAAMSGYRWGVTRKRIVLASETINN